MKAIKMISKKNVTKMFSLMIIFFTMFFSQQLKAADIVKSGDVLYVWAKTGLNLRQSPNIHAERITILLPGSQVQVLGFTQKAFAIETLTATEEEQNPFVIKGNWIFVQVGDVQGFVLDTYLLPMKAPKEGESLKHYMIAMSEHMSQLGTAESDEYSFDAETVNGMTIQYESGEYYQNIDIQIPNFTIEDGFVFYNFFNDIQGRSKAEDADVYLFKNWKEELSIFDDQAGEVSFRIQDGSLMISESIYDGC